ncbi:MAG: ExbD/TolR family protein [Bdellovibrionales bacterium]
MAIYVPGLRKRGHHGGGGGKRSAVVALNMTAMVDMFTVMCVFLLQNYATTNQVLPMPDKVDLPAAHEVKELLPANVVIIGEDGIMLNNLRVADFRTVKEQEDWTIQPLLENLKKSVEEAEASSKSVGNQIKKAVNKAKSDKEEPEIPDYMRITIQSDKNVDFLTVKKVMFTVTEAGMKEINFAVIKREGEAKPL